MHINYIRAKRKKKARQMNKIGSIEKIKDGYIKLILSKGKIKHINF